MSGEELQDDFVQDEIIAGDSSESTDIDTQDSQEDLAPSDADQHPKKVEFTPEQQEVMNREIGKKTFKLREAERKAKALEQELLRTRSEREQVSAPVVAPKPDLYDENYDQKLAEHTESIKAKAHWDAEQALLAKQHHEAERKAQIAKQETLQAAASDYVKRALQLGVSKDELANAGNAIQSYGIHDDLAETILADDSGPLITVYLANNIEDLDRVSSLPPAAAAMYIARHIVPKLSARKTKTTNAPEPAPVLRGNGAPPKDKYYVEGATFK